jgi:hypothetical protein
VEIIIMFFRLHNVLAFFCHSSAGTGLAGCLAFATWKKKKETLQEKGLRDVDEKGLD